VNSYICGQIRKILTMKNASLILNIVLIVAVLLLYIDRFANRTGSSATENSTVVNTGEGATVAYVEMDSLLFNYSLYNELREQFNQNQQRLESNLASKSRTLESKAADLQSKMEQRLVTQRQAEDMQRQLMQEQQNLLALRDEMASKLMSDEQVMNKQIFDSIQSYLKDLNKKSNFKIILSTTTGGSVLLADSTLNITKAVINGMNQRYKGQK